ncbi:putative dehydrogenase [Litorivivens lipolytica]|uniref:Putative dehydrogenase n=1 Tax=Litorivivens lipolytica TaxID=1524264 RepID=A0A7W4Z674_9GAMM|nr:Gfo/Idh/MocA family oxidoreductase [Litorivivens lipolytica]MBB3047897.1 putative dehydrogenase [Litorivivens lipolytica]
MKVVIIGTGFGENVVAPAWQSLGCEVEIVSPRDDVAVRKALAGKPDLVSIHSPPFMHKAHVLSALESGSAVLCDKPFGISTGDARAMYDAAMECGAPNFLNFEFRCRASNLKVKELVDSGAIGTLQHGSWQAWNHLLRERNHGWLFDAALGGGWLGAYGSHLIDNILWLTGSRVIECGGVSSISQTQRPDREGKLQDCTAEDAACFQLLLENGFTANVDISAAAPLYVEPRMTLIGSDGIIELYNDEALVLKRPDQREEKFTIEGEHNQFMGAQTAWLKNVKQALLDEAPLSPSFADGLATARVLEQLKRSLERP